ncbi:hypothetical protein CEXT_201411 [Caerostris extrusa]|uniref:Uncharacterized protein n=1 Tax=Caerostris extrusa TaxID=172846 RepID=A0AAV4P0S0_CAEEX|nr:hypothetical protein CEXT_201411 [Caerostris extrusa]
MLAHKSYTIAISENMKDVLRIQLDRSRRLVQRKWSMPWIETWYWNLFKEPVGKFETIFKTQSIVGELRIIRHGFVLRVLQYIFGRRQGGDA